MNKEAEGILDFIFNAESNLNYDLWNSGFVGSPDKPLSEMSVFEVMYWQQESRRNGGNSAAGAGQIIYPTLRKLVNEGVISEQSIFNEELQRKANFALLEGRGYNDWKSGRISDEKFGNNLAKEWASLPVLEATKRKNKLIDVGQSYYVGVSGNRALVSTDEFRNVLTGSGLGSSSFGEPTELSFLSSDVAQSASFDPNTAKATPNSGFWLKEQWLRQGNHNVDKPSWETGSYDFDNSSGMAQIGQSLPESDYLRTRRDNAQGPYMHPGWWKSFSDEWTDSFIYRGIKSEIAANRYSYDYSFNPAQQAIDDGFQSHHVHYLNSARNLDHYNYLTQQISEENDRQRRRGDSNHMFAQFAGAMLSPDSLVTLGLPIGWGATALRTTSQNFTRAALKSGTALGSAELAMQSGRMAYDPNKNAAYSAMAVGGATIGGALFGGAIGSYMGRQARKELVEQLGLEIAMRKGLGKHATQNIDIGGRTATVRYVTPDRMDEEMRLSLEMAGGVLHRSTPKGKAMGPIREADNPEILVSPEMLVRRWKNGDVPSGVRNPNELLEHEIAKRGALVKNGGQKIIDKAEKIVPVNAAKSEYEAALKVVKDTGKVSPSWLQKNMGISRSKAKKLVERMEKEGIVSAPDHAAKRQILKTPAFTPEAQSVPIRGEVQAGWRKATNSLSDAEMERLSKLVDEAEAEATVALKKYREENNKILADAKMEALGRILDSPFKYVHRNAKSYEVRDLINLLIDDGGLMQGAYRTGDVVMSVDRMKKAWDGRVNQLIENETRLYEEYLGFASNPTVGGIAVNKSFKNRRADGSRAMSVDEFRDATSRSLITGQSHEIPQVNQMANQLKTFYEEFRIPAEEYGVLRRGRAMEAGRANMARQLDELKRTHVENHPDVLKLKSELEDLDYQIKLTADDPSEDYFTRVYMVNAIEQNRALFKKRVVKPFMKQQPFGYIWKNDEWVYTKFKMTPKAIDKRADDLIDTILQEGEILDLAAHRASNRPSFGRTRQFNIPNSFLLKDGPNGNGIADFIDTNYVLNAKLYTDRMAPAIEMSRAFARPADGVDWVKGFNEAIADAREAEMLKFKGSEKEFDAHWETMEEKIRHVADRVTNRVFKDPNRWDNRMAMVLKDWSHLAFMGMSALSAIPEIGTIIMRHGMSRVFRAQFHDLDSAMAQVRKSAIAEGGRAGAMMDINMGAALASFSETGVEAALTSKPEMWLKTAANKYFLLNGLATVTTKLKQLDLTIRVPDMLDKIIKVGDDVATTDEIAELARYGISKSDAQRMAKEPIEEMDGMFLANTDMWGSQELAHKFRAAIKSGNENTIIAATAADKPVIADGVVYLKSNPIVDEFAAKLGAEKRGKSWKFQSGLLALPFTFWNYAIGATNKILLAGLDEATSQKMAGIASIVGLGYMVAAIKTPSERWDSMGLDDRIRVAIENSGIVGVLSNYSNLTQGSVIGLTGKNPFPWSPEHNYYPSAMDAMFNVAGAGPSVARNLVEGVATGDATMTSWAMPLRNHIFLKWLFDAAIDNLEGDKLQGVA